jgi:hypothetical protein
MTDLTDFLSHAWKTLAYAIAKVGVHADLHQVPERISKTVKRRVSAELKRLAILLRRLIFLMALQVELAPVKPRMGSNYFEKTEGEVKKTCTFSLMPTVAGETPYFLKGPQTVPDRGPVLAEPLIDRWQAMLETLKNAQRRAKCLARTLQRQRTEGEPKSYIVPIPNTHSFPAALALVSGGLAVQLTEALKDWPDTG